jgi:phosphate transport system protein
MEEKKLVDLAQHTSTQYSSELQGIKNHVLEMGGLVEKHINDALDAFVLGNTELAKNISQSDYQVNSLEVQIDEECNTLLALRQPVSSDLRFVIATVKTITDLERIGDEAERIARLGTKNRKENISRAQLRIISNLGEHVSSMLHDALDAYTRQDSEEAKRVVAEDELVDETYEAGMRELLTYMIEDPANIKGILDVIWCARGLERIGDHAKNICEYVLFMVHGKDVRHTSHEGK